MTAHPRRRFWLKFAAGLLFAVVAYVGAYALSVKPIPSWPGGPISPGDYLLPNYTGDYVLTGEDWWIERLFSPVHFIDRRLRPNLWHVPTSEPKRWEPQ